MRAVRLTALALGLLGLLGACGDDGSAFDSGPPDTGPVVDRSGDTGIFDVVIAPPMPAQLLPCPDGWREVPGASGAPDRCEPFPEGGHADCPVVEAHFPGTAGCEAIGDPCPADGWPAVLPASGVIFVRADAPAGGDGTRDAPLTTLADALVAAVDGGTIALAPGTHEGPLTIRRPVTIRGACTEVVITSTGRPPAITISSAGDVRLDNIRLSGAPDGILVSDSMLSLEEVVIDDIMGAGIASIGATVAGRRIRFDRMNDSAMQFSLGSTVELEKVSVTRLVNDVMRTMSSDAVVRDAVFVQDASGTMYFGTGSGGVVFEQSVFLGGGAILGLSAPRIELHDSLFLGPPVDEDAGFDGAIAAFEGGSLFVDRTRVERARGLALAVTDPTGVLTVTDTIIVDTVGTGGVGHAVELGIGASGTLSRVFIERAHAIGVLVAEPGTRMTASDVTVVDTQPDASGSLGRAFQVQSGARLDGERLFIRGSHEVAMVVAATAAVIDARDLVVEGTRPRACPGCTEAGIGVGAYLGGAVTLSRFALADNALSGLQLANDGSADLRDGLIRDNPIGVNIQVPDYDIGRLTRGVSFRGNGTNLDSTELPVPPPTAGR